MSNKTRSLIPVETVDIRVTLHEDAENSEILRLPETSAFSIETATTEDAFDGTVSWLRFLDQVAASVCDRRHGLGRCSHCPGPRFRLAEHKEVTNC